MTQIFTFSVGIFYYVVILRKQRNFRTCRLMTMAVFEWYIKTCQDK